MGWRGGGFSAYDLVHGVITAKATAPFASGYEVS